MLFDTSGGVYVCVVPDTTGLGCPTSNAMSNNKLTNMAPPTLSLGVGPATFSLATSNFSTLTTPTQPLGASSLTHTQPLGAAGPPLAPTLNLSASTLNTLNALNNPAQTLNALNNPAQTLNALNTTNQALAALTPSTPTALNTLNAPSVSPSSQPFLTSQPMTGIVSLPQNFCFPSQQTSMSAANQTAALGMALGFPMAAAAALNSNTVPLNTSTIPLNTSSLSLHTSTLPLNSGTLPLNAGSPLSQQLVQSLSMGQQAGAILPQTLNLSLGQALLGMSNSAGGASGNPFLSTNLGQFTGLPSVFMGGQPSVLQGALLGGGSSPGQTTPLQTIGTLNPQSLSFPLTTGPVITELPPTTSHQPANISQEAPPPAVSNLPEPLVSSEQQAPQELPAPTDKTEEPQTAAWSQQGSEAQPAIADTTTQEAQATADPQISAQSPGPPDPQEKPQTPSGDQELGQPLEETQAASEQTDKCPNPPEDPGSKTVTPDTVEGPLSPEIPLQFPLHTPEKERSSPATQPAESSSSSSKPAPSEAQQRASSEVKDTRPESAEPHCSGVIEERIDSEKIAEQSVEESSETITAKGNDEQPMDISSEVITCLDDIKQEIMETEDIFSPPLTEYTVPNSTSPNAPSPIKIEAASELDTYNPPPGHYHHLYPPTDLPPCRPTSSLQVSMGADLLKRVKQEEEEEEVALLPLPDSTPGGSEDSLDSYYQRHSPSPMASLQLTRADTTTTFSTTAAYVRPRLDDMEGPVDVKQLLGSGEYFTCLFCYPQN
ncbi:hypothetical protein ACOMHN_049290 [Nucella lapillus]